MIYEECNIIIIYVGIKSFVVTEFSSYSHAHMYNIYIYKASQQVNSICIIYLPDETNYFLSAKKLKKIK